MRINLTTNQILNKEQVLILRNATNVIVKNIKNDTSEWNGLSIVCIDDIEIIYVVESICEQYVIVKECMLHIPSSMVFSKVIGNVEHFNNYLIVK